MLMTIATLLELYRFPIDAALAEKQDRSELVNVEIGGQYGGKLTSFRVRSDRNMSQASNDPGVIPV